MAKTQILIKCIVFHTYNAKTIMKGSYEENDKRSTSQRGRKKLSAFCKKYKEMYTEQIENFNINDFKVINNLYREKMPITDEQWSRYIALSSNSKDIQFAIVSHPNATAAIIDRLFKETDVQADVCEHLFFSEKELSESVAKEVCAKSNANHLMEIYEIDNKVYPNSYCSNYIVNELCEENELDDCDKLCNYQQEAFCMMNSDKVAEKVVEKENVDETILQYICGNTHLGDDIRERIYKNGVNYLYLRSIPKPVIDDLYEKITYVSFGKEIKDSVNAKAFLPVKDEHLFLLASMVSAGLLSGGQVRNLLSLCNESKRYYPQIITSIAEKSTDESVLKDIYKMSQKLSGEDKSEIEECLMENPNLPEEIVTTYTKQMLQSLEDGTCIKMSFPYMTGFMNMARICTFNKDIEDALINLDLNKIDAETSATAQYIIGQFVDNKTVTKKVLDKFENHDSADIRLRTRIAREAQNNPSFGAFCNEKIGLYNALGRYDEIYNEADKFKESIRKIYGGEKVSFSEHSFDDEECGNTQKDIENVQMMFGLKEPTVRFLRDKKSSIQDYIARSNSQCDFYVRLGKYFKTIQDCDRQIKDFKKTNTQKEEPEL